MKANDNEGGVLLFVGEYEMDSTMLTEYPDVQLGANVQEGINRKNWGVLNSGWTNHGRSSKFSRAYLLACFSLIIFVSAYFEEGGFKIMCSL